MRVSLAFGILLGLIATEGHAVAGARGSNTDGAPISMSLSAPKSLGVSPSGSPKSIQVRVSGSVSRVASGAQVCGQAYLYRDFCTFVSQSFCVTTDARGGGTFEVLFTESLSASDWPVVLWSAYVRIDDWVSDSDYAATDIKFLRE